MFGIFNKGWHFRTVLKDELGSETIFFHALCYRNCYVGVLYKVGNYGAYWESVPINMNSGCILYLFSSLVYPLNYNGRSIGLVLCPVREKE